MINNVNAAYERALSENNGESLSMESGFQVYERNYEMQQHIDEMRRLSNRREKVDDEGNIIPNEDTYGGNWIPARLRANEENSWMCDKCMAINFGCQTACPECGDIRDGKDEELK